MSDPRPAEEPDYIRGWLERVAARAWLVVLGILLVSAAALHYAAANLSFNTDTVAMLDENLPFRQVHERFGQEFPGLDRNLVLVIEAPVPEQARAAAQRVYEALVRHPQRFPQVFWPGASEFLQRYGLLLRPLEDIDRLADRLSEAQPLLALLADDTRLDTLFAVLRQTEEHSRDDQTQGFAAVYADLAAVLNAVAAGEDRVTLSWQRLLGRESEPSGPAREVIVTEPRLDYDRVMAGAPAMSVVDDLRRDLGLDAGPVRLRVTGNVALSHEELESSLAGAGLAGSLALVVVLLVMGAGLRSVRLVAVGITTLISGFALTFGLATALVGTVNLISIAFAVLYIGLAVNYAIHFMLRYREQMAGGADHRDAIAAGGSRLGPALALSALTTAIGFLAFVPTAYAGVAELGLIAAASMGVTLALTYSLLPALLALAGPPGRLHHDRAGATLPRLTAMPYRYRSKVLAGTALATLLSLPLAWQVEFDSDPLNLRDPDAESLVTLRALLNRADSAYRDLQVIANGEQQARALAAELRRLPSVAGVRSLLTFVPDRADDKLDLIEAARSILGPAILEAQWQAPPATAGAVADTASALRAALEESGRPEAKALAESLETLTDRLSAEPALAEAAHRAALGALPDTMGRLVRSLAVEHPVGLEDLPDALRRQWVSREGSWRLQVSPHNPQADIAQLSEFVAQVRQVAPAVTGSPVLQIESGQAVSAAFVQAVGWAMIGIAVTVLVVLRSVTGAVLAIVPLLIGGTATAALMTVTGVPFNFANVIAVPLLLGVGIDNGIHLVLRHRHGELPQGNVLRTHTARAIVFGSMTTALSFANLMLSPHAGTASLGFLLAAGLSLVVLTTLVVLPALLVRRTAG